MQKPLNNSMSIDARNGRRRQSATSQAHQTARPIGSPDLEDPAETMKLTQKQEKCKQMAAKGK